MSNSKLATPIQYVKGVGPKLAKIFAKLGVFTVEDLLYLVPREWEDRSNIKPIAQIRPSSFEVVKGEIRDIDVLQTRSRFSVLKVYIGDRTAETIKVDIGSALPVDDENMKKEIKGRDLITGLPNTAEIRSQEVTAAIAEIGRNHPRDQKRAPRDTAGTCVRHHGPRHRLVRRRRAPAQY